MFVQKRTHNILTTMFSANYEETATTVDWDSFGLAMGDVGFSARNTGGSAGGFEKKDGDECQVEWEDRFPPAASRRIPSRRLNR